MEKIFLLLTFCGMLFCIVPLHAQTTVSLNPVKDNTLYESATGNVSNGTGDHFFVGLTNLNSKRRGLIQFDIAANVPAGATILEATLTLRMDQTNSGPNNVELHAITVDWGESASVASGSGGNGAIAQINDATWLHNFYNNSFWNNPGGDFNALLSATVSVNGIGTYNWTSTQLTADVQKWLDTPTSNFGWCLIGNETSKQSAMRFASREIVTATSRPLLTVVYTAPLSTQELISGTYCTIFPNPSSGILQLAVRDAPNAEIKIFSAEGQAIYSQPVIADKMTIDLSSKPAGVYIYRLLINHQTIETGKIIIRK